jgi:hypothetical protein
MIDRDFFASLFKLLHSIRLVRASKTSFVESLPREGCLKSNSCIMPYFLMKALISPG